MTESPHDTPKSDIENPPEGHVSWPVLYALVLGAFVVYVILLTAFTYHFTRTTS